MTTFRTFYYSLQFAFNHKFEALMWFHDIPSFDQIINDTIETKLYYHCMTDHENMS